MEKLIQIKSANDGSHTLYRKDIDEHYHSIHGSIQESLHVFINAGLKDYLLKYKKNEINILEVGFGSGLNALLTMENNKDSSCKINYHTIEPFPLEYSLIEQINFKEINPTIFLKLHKLNWNEKFLINTNFNFSKEQIKLENFTSKIKFDIIYYDAFGPNSQPEMWNIHLFTKLYSLMNKSGFLVTYCAKGQVRRDLNSVGFKMERLPGPKGKREMLRALK